MKKVIKKAKSVQRVPAWLIVETYKSFGILDQNEQNMLSRKLIYLFDALDEEWNAAPQAERDEALREGFWAPLASDLYSVLEENGWGICAYS
jgi:hypothetical protein